MLVAFIAKDKKGALEIRKATRSDHLAYLEATSDVVKQAGPLLDENDEMAGSLIILEVEDIPAAQAWAAADPYAKAGLFEATQCIAWKKVI